MKNSIYRTKTIPPGRITFPLLLLTAGLMLVQPCAGQGGTWMVTGSLANARVYHAATVLQSGKVLVAGGSNGGVLSSAELYDPASGMWTATGRMGTARREQTATLLPNGKVLVAGGFDLSNALTSAELYDPASGTWAATGSMGTARFSQTASLLTSDKVMVAGGYNSNDGYLSSAELYDPASGTWTTTGSMGTARTDHTATFLPNGKVLVAGGTSGGSTAFASAELYDQASGTWAATGSLATGRYNHTATLLPNGEALVAGGYGEFGVTIASAELYVSDGGGLTLVSAASRLTHGSAGDFDINMPLSGTSGVEDRASGATHAVFNFNAPVTSGDVSVTGGSATAGTPSFNGNTISVPLTGVADVQIVTLTVSNVNGQGGSTDVDFGFLIGDVNGDHMVTRQDGKKIRAGLGQVVNGSNFTEDINLNGRVSKPDLSIMQTKLGNSIP